MSRLRTLIVILFLSFQSQAQMVLNDVLCVDNAPIVFNPEFIKRYHIRTIEGRISTKQPKKTIRKTNRYYGYVFDREGRISYSFETKNYRDTMFRRYYYNDKGRLIYQSFEETDFLRYESYLWDAKGRIKAIEAFERKNDRMGIPFTKSVRNESFNFEPCDSTCVKIIKNKVGTPYMKVETFKNDKGLRTRVENRYLATNEGTIEYFTYDSDSRLIKRELVTSKQKLNKEMCTFSYDHFGNLKSKQVYKAGVLQYETQVIVNEKSGFLSAVIEQEGNTNSLRIISFNSFNYFD